MAEMPEVIDHAKFLQMLTDEFPEVPEAFDECSKGLLHCEMGVFAGLTDEAISQGNYNKASRYLNFADRIRKSAGAIRGRAPPACAA